MLVQKITSVHKLVFTDFGAKKTKDGNVIDHIDRDPLNNAKNNLREVTPSENAKNRAKPTGTKGTRTSRFNYVSWNNARQGWLIQLTLDSGERHTSFQKIEEHAA